MPAFPYPFNGNIERKITKDELVQALLQDLGGELEAIFTYQAHYLATDDKLAKKVLSSIRNEEIAHVGELISLIEHLAPGSVEHFVDGRQEFKDMLKELGMS